MIAGDGSLGQMMEPVEMPPFKEVSDERSEWALTGAQGRQPRSVSSLYLRAEDLEAFNRRLQAKLAVIAANEPRYETYMIDDAEILVVAFGSVGRIAQSAVRKARALGINVGLFRPITLWPFPNEALDRISRRMKHLLVVEMNAGQMLDDVKMTVQGRIPIEFLGRMGGMIPLPDEILAAIPRMQPPVCANGFHPVTIDKLPHN
jgi:2-oxoglutarate ferredoxin oxidoreductase subunit alpha